MWNSEEDLRAMVGRFVEVCMRSEIQCRQDQGDGMNGEEGLKYEVYVHRILLDFRASLGI